LPFFVRKILENNLFLKNLITYILFTFFMANKIIKEQTCQTILHDTSKYLLNLLIFPHRLVANAYVGCGHDCVYCYARWYTRKGQITAKTNAYERLKQELQKRIGNNKPREPVCFGSISDPYQPIEQKYEITRKMLEVCDELSYPCFIVTKSDLVMRDKDVLSSLAKRNLVAVNFTITPLNNEILAKVEPYTPNNEKRLKAMYMLTKAGIPCSIYLSPIFPVLSENLLDFYLKKASDNGAKCCSAIFLKIRPIVWKYVKDFLMNHYNFLINKYEELYFKQGDIDLSNYRLPEYTYRRKTMETIAETCKRYNLKFTSEEFFDLWTTPYSDCVDINCWHNPTAYNGWRCLKT
ncbi:MAG: radical SAM protein, partial [Candidatus Bathyarchaeia archaeon]